MGKRRQILGIAGKANCGGIKRAVSLNFCELFYGPFMAFILEITPTQRNLSFFCEVLLRISFDKRTELADGKSMISTQAVSLS